MRVDVEPSFPLVEVKESRPFERGVALGAASRRWIEESVATYRETFDHYTGLPWPRIQEVALEFADPIGAYDAGILEEMEGMAVGAEVALGDVLAINCRSEIMFGLDVRVPSECSAFYAGPAATADGHVLLGENWDWRPRSARSTILVEIDQEDAGPAFAMLPEAGMVGKNGFNEAGIGVTVNAILCDADRGERDVPIHVVLRGILQSTTIEEATAAVVRARRGASATYTIAAATGNGVAVEAGPGGVETVALVHPVGDLIAHANHFCAELPLRDLGRERYPDTLARGARMTALLAERRGTIDRDWLKRVLADEAGHPKSICRHPDPEEHPVETTSTVASMIFDLTERSAEIAAGAPSVEPFRTYVPAFAAASAGRPA